MKDFKKAETESVSIFFARLNLCFVIISVALPTYMVLGNPISRELTRFGPFSRLDISEISDRMTVILLLTLMLALFFFLPKFSLASAPKRVLNTINFVATFLLLASFSWRWGDETYESLRGRLWYGWGDKLGLLLLVLGFALLLVIQTLKENFLPALIKAQDITNFVAWAIFLLYYLPSFLQPFNGLIELHHTRYILNDFLIPASGRMPYTDIMPQYVSLLGWPIKIISYISPDLAVNSSLIWLNILVLFEVLLLGWITRFVLNLRFWSISLLIPTAVVFIKVQPNEQIWGSIAQHVNLVPARTILPIALLVLLLKLSKTNVSTRKSDLLLPFVLGVTITLTAFNNPEFGLPASSVAILISALLTKQHEISSKKFIQIITSAVVTLSTILVLYSLSGNMISLNTWMTMIRVHGLDGYMNLPMPDFGLWVFFYAVLGSAAIVGSSMLFRKQKNSPPAIFDLQAAILLAFSGLWGATTLFYFSGRSLVPEIVVFLIPLSLIVVGFMKLGLNSIRSFHPENREIPLFNYLLPVAIIVCIPVVSLFSSPNPAFEWRRVAGHGERWSTNYITEKPSYKELLNLVEERADKKYLFFGNNGPAIETLSGVENGLGIISLEDIGINPLMAKVACSLILESDAHFLVSPKSDWPDDWSFNSPPCPGLTLVEFNDDSELLIFAINTRD